MTPLVTSSVRVCRCLASYSLLYKLTAATIASPDGYARLDKSWYIIILWHIAQFQVGLMHLLNGSLKKVRGSTIMLTVNPKSTADEILQLAVDKHRSCNISLPRTQYRLLYPDGQDVKYIPGTNDPFTLLAYKQFIGKSYQKLLLLICDNEDYDSGMLKCELRLLRTYRTWVGETISRNVNEPYLIPVCLCIFTHNTCQKYRRFVSSSEVCTFTAEHRTTWHAATSAVIIPSEL